MPGTADKQPILLPGTGEQLLPIPRLLRAFGWRHVRISQGEYECAMDASRIMGDLGIGQYDRLERRYDLCGRASIFVLFSEDHVYTSDLGWNMVEVDPAKEIGCLECRLLHDCQNHTDVEESVSALWCNECRRFTQHEFREQLAERLFVWACAECRATGQRSMPPGTKQFPRSAKITGYRLCSGCKIAYVKPDDTTGLCSACKQKKEREQMVNMPKPRADWTNALFEGVF